MIETFYNRYKRYEGINVYDDLTQIPECTCYNNEYFWGFIPEGSDKADLIYVHSTDDDNIMKIYHIDGNNQIFIGYADIFDCIINLCETELY